MARPNSKSKLAVTLAVLAAFASPAVPAFADNDHEQHDALILKTAVVQRSDSAGFGAVYAALAPYCDDIVNGGQFTDGKTRLLRYELRVGATEQQVHDAIQLLVAEGVLQWGEANFGAHAVEGQTGSIWVTDISASNYAYHNQYAAQLLGLQQAHVTSRGNGAIVAIVDSGIDVTHEAVAGPLASWQWDFVDGDANPLDEGDGIDNDADGLIDEGVGHGTYVSSLIRLCAPEAKLMHIRVLNTDGRSDSFTFAAGIDSATDHGAQIINVSVSTEFNSSVVRAAVARAKAAGVIVIAAIGNDGVQIPLVTEFPASYSECYAVCATNSNDILSPNSNFGLCAAFSAPGVSAQAADGSYSLATSILGAVPGSGYAHWNGTSLSTALMTGSVALVRAQYPQWPDASVPAAAVPDAIMALFAQTVVPIDAINPNYVGLIGDGRVNAAGAVALGPPAPQVGDIDGDGAVTGGDLAMLLSNWGACTMSCTEDLNGDGSVDGADLSMLMSNWG